MAGMSPRSTIHSDLTAKSARQREAAQHAPRPSRIRFSIQTAGVGESRLVGRQALNFGALLLDEPTFSYGVVATSSLSTGQLPIATATVLRWLKNANGMYTGAELGFKVESAKSDIRLKFSLTFEASTVRSTVGTDTTALDASRGQNTYSGTAQQAGTQPIAADDL